ncbi:MAG: SAM-dependent methyltransferase [Nitrosopumilales archaeon CG15_BIG_FIL_POST_REV_8_21_14_020_37_12]|nr:MAG: SAM-dependent methyltransferase [Nitrosopumilales archaeon CG15_BIG_FIL_POST_REV_8_21_14_020_37_12]
MKIEEYFKSLPENILSGEDVQLSDKSFRDIFSFADLREDDIFYHLGCGDGRGIEIALEEYRVKKAVGIDVNKEKIIQARNNQSKNSSVELICEDIQDSKISDATVILFWFTDEEIINSMMKKFELLNPGTRVITIWGPLPECLPEKVKFPYIINKVPFKKANSLQEQTLSVFGVKCVDFVTAWEFAERYTKAIGTNVKNDRFLTIIQTLIIWINAKKLGVSCGDEVPESIKTYINIMKTHFDIDFEHLLKE